MRTPESARLPGGGPAFRRGSALPVVEPCGLVVAAHDYVQNFAGPTFPDGHEAARNDRRHHLRAADLANQLTRVRVTTRSVVPTAPPCATGARFSLPLGPRRRRVSMRS